MKKTSLSERRFRSLKVNAPDGVASLDLDQPFAHAIARLWQPARQQEANAYWFLPNRRICAEVSHALRQLQHSKTPSRMPIIRPVADVSPVLWASLGVTTLNKIQHAVPEGLRNALLIRLIAAYRQSRDQTPLSSNRLYAYAQTLNEALQDLLLERVDYSQLESYFVGDTSEHAHQNRLFFKDVLFRYWPKILAEHNYIEQSEHEWETIDAIEKTWQAKPPSHEILIAGSTGARPTTAKLMTIVRSLPNGFVLLPGLTPTEIGEHKRILNAPEHAHHAMHMWINREGLAPNRIQHICVPTIKDSAIRSRITRLHESASTSMKSVITETEALSGLSQLTARNEEEESLLILALVQEYIAMRKDKPLASSSSDSDHNLTPLSKCLIVVPSKDLARRISSKLESHQISYRWIPGDAMNQHQFGKWLMLVVRMMTGERSLSHLLDLLSHPMTHLPGTLQDLHRYQKAWLSAPIPFHPETFATFVADCSRLSSTSRRYCTPEEVQFATAIAPQLSPLFLDFSGPRSFNSWLDAITSAINSLTSNSIEKMVDPSVLSAWKSLLVNIMNTSEFYPPLHGYEAADLIQTFLLSTQLPQQSTDADVTILNPFLARYATAERIIIAGFNDDQWPGKHANFWLSRRLRSELKMSDPSHRIGLMVHDLLHLLTNTSVIFTRSRTINRVPMQASRWLRVWRTHIQEHGHFYSWWWRRHAYEHMKQNPRRAPHPSPPVALRPAKITPSELKVLLKSPYQYYCSSIIKLPQPSSLDDSPQRILGIVVHDALQIFVREYVKTPSTLLEADLSILSSQLYEIMLARLKEHTDIMRFPLLRARARNIAHTVLAQFYNCVRKRNPSVMASEQRVAATMRLELNGEEKMFSLAAICDRIDFGPEGTDIIDYKTGKINKIDIIGGKEVQLGLEAWLMLQKEDSDASQNAFRVHIWQCSGEEQSQEHSFPVVYGEDKKNDLPKNALYLPQFIGHLNDLLVYYFMSPAAHFSPNPDMSNSKVQFSPHQRHFSVLSRQFEWDK